MAGLAGVPVGVAAEGRHAQNARIGRGRWEEYAASVEVGHAVLCRADGGGAMFIQVLRRAGARGGIVGEGRRSRAMASSDFIWPSRPGRQDVALRPKAQGIPKLP